MSVSQSSSSVVFDRAGKPAGERDVDQSIGFGVTRNTYSAHIKFSENTQAEKVVDRSARKLVITNSKQLMQKKNAEFYEKNYGDSKWIFVKFINKVLQRWRNYENSQVLHSIRSQDESSSRTRTLFWNYQAEYKNYKMK